MAHHTAVLLAAMCAAGVPGELDWPNVFGGRHLTQCTTRLPAATRTLLGIRLEEGTTAEQVMEQFEKVLGPSPLQSEGDAADSFEWRCWEAANGDGTVLVVGRGEVDTEFRLLGAGMRFAARGSCPKSKLVSRSLATADGVRLGLSRAAVERKVGRATTVGEAWFARECSSKLPMTEAQRIEAGLSAGEAFDVSSSVTLVESHGRVEGIRVEWAVTD